MFDQSSDANAAKFNRAPAIRVLIKDLEEGDWNDTEKVLVSRYGKLKRVRFIGTVIEKREVLDDNQSESFLSNETKSKSRVTFLIDDGTGRIWATQWGALPEDFVHIKKGELVEICGIIRYYKSHPTLSFEFIKNLNNPNFEAYHILTILNTRKSKPRYEFTKSAQEDTFSDFGFPKNKRQSSNKESSVLDDLESEESNYDASKSEKISTENKKAELNPNKIKVISDSKPNNKDILKQLDTTQQILDFIESNDNGDGASLKEMAQSLGIEESILKKQMDQLCQDIKIYKVKPGYYSSYNK
jgi:RPA family protein